MNESATLNANYESLRTDLENLNTSLKDAFALYRDQPLLASHPVYQYLARAAGLTLTSLHWEPGQMPPPEEWAKLDSHPAKWILWEAEPSAEIAAELNRRAIQTIVFNPCATTPAAGDYLTVMKANIQQLARIVP